VEKKTKPWQQEGDTTRSEDCQGRGGARGVIKEKRPLGLTKTEGWDSQEKRSEGISEKNKGLVPKDR